MVCPLCEWSILWYLYIARLGGSASASAWHRQQQQPRKPFSSLMSQAHSLSNDGSLMVVESIERRTWISPNQAPRAFGIWCHQSMHRTSYAFAMHHHHIIPDPTGTLLQSAAGGEIPPKECGRIFLHGSQLWSPNFVVCVLLVKSSQHRLRSKFPNVFWSTQCFHVFGVSWCCPFVLGKSINSIITFSFNWFPFKSFSM